MAYVTKDWKDSPDTSTPISAEALEDLETRLSGYTDEQVAAVTVGAISDVPGLQAALNALQASATAATDTELASAVSTLQAGIDGSATDADLSSAVATINAAMATDAELASEVATVNSAVSAKLSASLLGQPNGVASLGSDGKVPGTQLPVGGGVSEALGGVDPTKAPHNADPTGVADATTAFRSAFAAARALGTHVAPPPGVYTISGRIHDAAPTALPVNLIAQVPGTVTIQRSAATRIIDVQGTISASVALSADVALGATSFTVASLPGGSLADGDYITLRSNVNFYTTNVGTAKVSEVAIVKSVTGTGPYTVTLYGPTEESYAVADSAAVYKYTLAPGPYVRGIQFKQDVVNRGDTSDCFFIYRAKGARVQECEFRDLDWPALSINHSQITRVRDCHFENLIDNTPQNRIGYGINLHGNCRDTLIVGATGRWVRHLFSTNGDPEGVPRHWKLIGCIGWENSSATFSSHKEGKYGQYVGCESHGGSGGFYERAQYVTLTDCKVFGATGSAAVIGAETDAVGGRIVGGEYHVAPSSISSVIQVSSPDCSIDAAKCVSWGGGGKNSIEVTNNGTTTGTSAMKGQNCHIRNVISVNPSQSRHFAFAGDCGTKNVISNVWCERAAGGHGLLSSTNTATKIHIGHFAGDTNFLNGQSLDNIGGASNFATLVVDDTPGEVQTIVGFTNLTVKQRRNRVDCTTGARTVNLPTAIGNMNLTFSFQKVDATASAVTVVPSGTQTINGVNASVILRGMGERLAIRATSTGNWEIVERSNAGWTQGNLGAAFTPDAGQRARSYINGTLNANLTLSAPTNGVAGSEILLKVTQDATGGRTITLSGIQSPGGTGLTLTGTAASTDLIRLTYDGTNWLARVEALAFA